MPETHCAADAEIAVRPRSNASNPFVTSSNRLSSSAITSPGAFPSPLASSSARCAGAGSAEGGGASEEDVIRPRRGDELAVMNSEGTGSLTWAKRSAGGSHQLGIKSSASDMQQS